MNVAFILLKRNDIHKWHHLNSSYRFKLTQQELMLCRQEVLTQVLRWRWKPTYLVLKIHIQQL